MSMEAVGTYGAKRQSQKSANPYGYIRKLMDSHPRLSKSALREKSNAIIRAAIAKGDWGIFDAMHEYWFSNCHDNLSESEPAQSHAENKQKREAAAAQQAERVAAVLPAIKDRIERMVLSDLIMSNGKRLGDNNKADLLKESGWTSKIAAKLTGKKTVDQTLSNDELWKLRGK